MSIKLAIITSGKSKKKGLEEMISLYKKRMQNLLKVEEIFVKNLDLPTLEKFSYIALDLSGKSWTSEEFAQNLFQWTTRKNLAFVIGNEEGLSQDVLHQALAVISLSSLTFTHQMARLILIEQIYRSVEIQKGSRYHK